MLSPLQNLFVNFSESLFDAFNVVLGDVNGDTSGVVVHRAMLLALTRHCEVILIIETQDLNSSIRLAKLLMFSSVKPNLYIFDIHKAPHGIGAEPH